MLLDYTSQRIIEAAHRLDGGAVDRGTRDDESCATTARRTFGFASSASPELLPFAAVFLDMCIQSLASLQKRISRVFRPLIGVLKLFGLRVLQGPSAFDINSPVRL
jgi:hypothetical protein